MKEFLAMGGYAFYVWSAFGLTLIVLVAGALLPLLHERRLLRAIASRARENP